MASNDEGSEFPEPPEGIVRPDTDSVFGFLDEGDQVQAAMEELVAQGFDRERIYVLCGPKGAERLDVSGRQHGLRGRVYRLVEWMGDEKGLLFDARDHLSAGGMLMSIHADDDAKAAVARVLSAHGARHIYHFGRGHWEPLGP